MRSPSRFVLSVLSTVVTLSLANAASAGSLEQASSIDPTAFQPITRVALDDALETAAARVDDRLNVPLSGPTTMECTNNLDAGFETCVVRAEGVPAAAPAALARN